MHCCLFHLFLGFTFPGVTFSIVQHVCPACRCGYRKRSAVRRGAGLHVDMACLLFLYISFGWGLPFSVHSSFINFILWLNCFYLLFGASLSFHKPSPRKTIDAVISECCEVNPVGGVKNLLVLWGNWCHFFHVLLNLAGFIKPSKKIFMSIVLATNQVSLMLFLFSAHCLRSILSDRDTMSISDFTTCVTASRHVSKDAR